MEGRMLNESRDDGAKDVQYARGGYVSVGHLTSTKGKRTETQYTRRNHFKWTFPKNQGFGRLRGVVRNSLSGIPVQGATVELLDGPQGFDVPVLKTDQAGSFLFSGIPWGPWKLWVHRSGFDGIARDIHISGDSGRLPQALALAPQMGSPTQVLFVVTWERSVIGVRPSVYFGQCKVTEKRSACRDGITSAHLNGMAGSTWGPASISVNDVGGHTLRFFIEPPWGRSIQAQSIYDTLKAARPTVQLYFGGKKTEIHFSPDLSVVGRRGWHVLDIDGQTNAIITPQLENDATW
jgi:hypothetical protein